MTEDHCHLAIILAARDLRWWSQSACGGHAHVMSFREGPPPSRQEEQKKHTTDQQLTPRSGAGNIAWRQ